MHVEQVLRRYGFAVVPGFVYAEKELVLDVDEQERELCHHEQERGDAVRFGVVDALAQVAEGVVQPQVRRDGGRGKENRGGGEQECFVVRVVCCGDCPDAVVEAE